MSAQQRVGAVADLPPGKVVGAGRFAVGNAGGRYFAVTRRCRHLGADLVRAENPIHGSDQQSCPPGASAVMITYHVPEVRLPIDHAGRRVAPAVPA
jgi:hypothetical protein